MNIAFFTHYTSLYGANRSLINLADGLTDNGLKVFLVSPALGPITEYFKFKKYPVFIHPLQSFLTKEGTVKKNVLQRLENLTQNLHILISQLKKWSVDIVYTNSSVIDSGIICSKIIEKPHIWHIREFGDLDYGIYPDVGNPLFQRLLCASNGIIFISKALRDHILPSFSHPNSEVIYNGVARSTFIYEIFNNSKKFAKSKINTFSIVGLVTKKKGQHIAISSFLEVLKSYPQSKLFIAGNGDMLPQLKKFVYTEKLYKNVIFLDNIIEPFGLFMNTDVALMCSESEAMGRVTAEAMTCLCPVIGTKSGANPELINHGQTGYLYDTPKELSYYMRKMIANPGKTKRMSLKAWETAIQNYSIEHYTKNVLQVINAVSSQSSSGAREIFSDNIEKYYQENNEPFWSIYNNFVDLNSVGITCNIKSS